MTFLQALVEAQRLGCACRPVGSGAFAYGVRGPVVMGIDFATGATTAALPNKAALLLGPWEVVNPGKAKDCLTAVFAAELAAIDAGAKRESEMKLSELVQAICPSRPAREVRLADLF